MPYRPESDALRSFIDDELLRAPLLIDEVLQAVIDGAARTLPHAGGASSVTDIARHRPVMVAAFVDSLRRHAGGAGAPSDLPSGDDELTLVDESALAADVELARTAEQIAATAEYELRELGAYTSALAGDLNVARDTNPFGPHVHAQALWAAAQALPVSANAAVSVMRLAAPPLAKALRRAYAAACTRLEDAGVEPAVHRTLILAPSAPGTAPMTGASTAPVAETQAWQTHVSASMRGDLEPATGGPSPAVDEQHLELLARLFDALALDPQIPTGLKALLMRLQGSVLRVSLRDPQTLMDLDHPVWLTMDRLAFALQLHPRRDDPVRQQVSKYAESLIESIQRAESHDAALYRWALDRIGVFETHLLQRRQAALSDRVAALEQQLREVPPAADPGGSPTAPIDLAALDTVPAALFDGLERSRQTGGNLAPQDLARCRVGEWFQVFLRGHWRTTQLLWADAGGGLWLLGAADTPQSWALTRSTLDRLQAEGLLRPLTPRSLARAAAQRTLRRGAHSPV